MKTIGNPKKEAEIYVGKIFKGKFDTCIGLIEAFASIPELDIPLIDIEPIKKIVRNKDGSIDPKECKNFLLGKNPELLGVVKELDLAAKELIGNSLLMHEYLHHVRVLNMEDEVGAVETIPELAQIIDKYSLPNLDQEMLKNFVMTLPELVKTLDSIYDMYGTGYDQYTCKALPQNPKEILQYFYELVPELFKMNLTPNVGECISQAVTTLSMLCSVTSTPAIKDALEELISSLKEPDTYYARVIRGDITQSVAAKAYCSIMQEHALDFVVSALDVVMDMDNQKQLTFKKGFGIDTNDPQLINICSNYIQLGYVTRGI